jgi:hypothetical protein
LAGVENNFMKKTGWFLLIGGLCTDTYFFWFFDTTVNGYYNAGLLNTRLCGVIIGLVTWLGGLVVIAMSSRQPAAIISTLRSDPIAASPIDDSDLVKSQKLSEDPQVQWLRDCVRADKDGRPRPAKPSAGHPAT